jgi:hypothetical protein
MISENINEVRENIRCACQRAGRDASEVTLIAVSKTKPLSMLEEALEAGMADFGENKVQELCDKYEVLSAKYPDIRWHMIGHLQRNKVKYIIDRAALIHSVDSLRLAEQISAESVKKNCTAHILLEVNVAAEETKFGVSVEETPILAEQISHLPAICIDGLMTIAPYVENPEENRWIFRKLKQLSIDIAGRNLDNVSMGVLSMGMTNDYVVAVEEGATMVRVGTGIFGERNYTI